MNENNSSGSGKFLLAILLIAGVIIGFIIFSSPGGAQGSNNSSENATITGNTQYVDVTAKVGYKPTSITAKGGVNTILRVSTSNTFDCSSSIRINQLGISKILPPNGTTEIPLNSQPKGSQLLATCGMGMYRFTINFI